MKTMTGFLALVMALFSFASLAASSSWPSFRCSLRNPDLYGLRAQNQSDDNRFYFTLGTAPRQNRNLDFVAEVNDTRYQVELKGRYNRVSDEARVFVDVRGPEKTLLSTNGTELNTYLYLRNGEWSDVIGVECQKR